MLMIQRVQTVYLLIVVVLMACLFVVPFAEFISLSELGSMRFTACGLFETDADGRAAAYVMRSTTWPLTVLAALTGVVALITIMLFKRRMLQIRLCVLNMVLLVGLQVMLIVLVKMLTAQPELLGGSSQMGFKLIAVSPLISAILTYLALRAIGRDEALVRSLDRLR